MASLSSGTRTRLKPILRALLTVVLAYAVCRRIDPGALARSASELGLPTLTGVALLTALTPFCAALRWQRVLARVSERVGFGSLLGDSLVGSAYNLVLPTSMGGDVVRSLRCATRVREPSAAYGSVLFERLLGLLALGAAAVVGALGSSGSTGATLAAALGSSLFLIVLVLRYAGKSLDRVARALQRWPRLRERTSQVAAVLDGPLARSGSLAETCAWSLLYQFCNLSIAAMVLYGLGEPRWFAAAYWGLPLALLLASAPVTIGGFGLREALFVRLLSDHGVSAERALLLSIVWVTSSLALALGGLVVLAKERAWSTA